VTVFLLVEGSARSAGMAEAGPAGSESELVLRVKMIDGREIQVAVPRAGRIADVAEKVLEAEDAPIHKMIRLIYGGRLMQPENPIAVYNIGPQVVIHAGERSRQPLDPALGLLRVVCTRRCALRLLRAVNVTGCTLTRTQTHRRSQSFATRLSTWQAAVQPTATPYTEAALMQGQMSSHGAPDPPRIGGQLR